MSSSIIKLVYWNSIPNFGDQISPKLVMFLSRKLVCHIYDPNFNGKMFGVGSILFFNGLKINSNDVVWGSGSLYDLYNAPTKPIVPDQNAKINLVRGPLTRNNMISLGVDCPEKYCDPGVLAPFMYGIDVNQPKKYDYAVIPHWRDLNDKLVRCRLYSIPNSTIINPCSTDIPDILNTMCQSKIVLSSSLHGIIMAEAMKIPCVWMQFSNNVEGGTFKFLDYFLGSGRDEDCVNPMIMDGVFNQNELRFLPKPKYDFLNLIQSFPYDIPYIDILTKIEQYYGEDMFK